MTPDILSFFQNKSFLVLSAKIPLLFLIFLYVIFTFIVLNRIRSLNRAVRITSQNATSLITFLSFAYFIAALSLFLLTLVIV